MRTTAGFSSGLIWIGVIQPSHRARWRVAELGIPLESAWAEVLQSTHVGGLLSPIPVIACSHKSYQVHGCAGIAATMISGLR